MKRISSRGNGFTLIEIAVVLAIVGLLAAGLTALLTTFLKATKARVASDNATAVQQALQRFIERSGRLPCPALVATGIADTATNLSATSCPNVAIGNGMARGVVPWATLGLPVDQVQDGYARMFTYHVTVAATLTTLSTQPPPPVTSANAIGAVRGNMTVHTGVPAVMGLSVAAGRNQINSCWNNPGTTPPAGENSCNLNAVVVLISHGENGFSAFTSQGGQLPASIALAEIENSNNTAAFVKSDPTAAGFDDLVFAWAPDDLMDPLIRRNTVRAAATASQDAARNTAIAVANAIVNSATQCVPVLPATACTPNVATIPAVPAGPPFTVLGVLLPNDAWGTSLVYATPIPVANICDNPPAGGAVAFTVTSWGIDATPGTNADTGINDDFAITVSVDQMRSQIATRWGSCG